MPGELPENTWMAEEIVSGMQPCCIAASAGDLAGADRALPRLDAGLVDDVLRHAHLDADRDVRVLRHRAPGLLGMREAEVEKLGLGEAGEADVRDVHEGVEARARLRR